MVKVAYRHSALFQNIKVLINEAKSHTARQVNSTLLFMNFQIGRMIIENEQSGNQRAGYAKSTLINLSKSLTKEFGSGYSVDNLELMRKLFLAYSISETPSRKLKSSSKNTKSETPSRKSQKQGIAAVTGLSSELTWSHYVQLLKIQQEDERRFYEIESIQNHWSVKELQRQYHSSLYERLALSKNKKGIKDLARKGQVIEKPTDALKHHLVLEFLDLKEESSYSENDLESAIINKLEHFMLELGKGFLFEARQKRFTFEGDNFFVDLVFYNRLLNCFILFDLKIGKLTHQDIGQMQMYVNYYDRFVKMKKENPTIGIILCKEENKTVVEITLPKNNSQVFAKEYKLYLPSKEQLKKQLL